MNNSESLVTHRTIAAIGAKTRRMPVLREVSDKSHNNFNTTALRISNAMFRRAQIDELGSEEPSVPKGSLFINNLEFHSAEFAAFVVRAVAYAEDNDNGDPLACGDHGEFLVDGKCVSWAIKLDTPCGTLASAPNADPSQVSRNLTITLPVN